jgi:integrase
MPPPDHFTPTLQKLIDQIRSDPILSAAARTELCSAIRRFAEICGKHPADVIADPAVIRCLIKGASWQLAGISKESWANIKSKLTRAMKIVDIKVDRHRRNYKLGPDWDALLASMSRRDRDELHRFAGWCSTLDIRPDVVDQAIFDRYRVELEAQSIQINPRERWHRARRVWNRTLAASPSFPIIDGVKPMGRRSLPWSHLPPGLLAELEDYKKAVTATSVFDLDKRKPIKPVTLEGYVSNLRLYLSDLVDHGVPLTELGSLAACIEPKRVKHGLELLLAGRDLDERTKPGLSALMVSILSVAHHIGVAEADLKELRKLHKKVRHVPEGMCERNERRLAQIEDPEVLRAFVNLPFRVAKRHAEVAAPTISEALEMQMAALLAILLFLPVRIKNAAALDLDKHLRIPVGGGAGRWHVHFGPHEVKNAKAIDGRFNEIVSALLARYVDVFRPVLLKRPSSKLFVSQHGTGKGSNVLSTQFSRFVRREIGLIFNAHLMRHFAAFAYLKANPGHYESVRQMLGHKSIATTVKFYSKEAADNAFSRYDGIISAQLDRSALSLTRPPKKTSKRTKKIEEVD